MFFRCLILFFCLSCFSGTVVAQGEKSIAELQKELRSATSKDERLAILVDLAHAWSPINPDSTLSIGRYVQENYSSKAAKVSALSVMVIGYHEKGDFQQALVTAKEYLDMVIDSKDFSVIGNAYNEMGVSYDYMGQYDSAIKYYGLGLQYRIQSQNLSAVAGSVSNLGLVYYLKGDLQKAMGYLYQGKHLAAIVQDESLSSTCMINLSLVYIAMKDYEKALEQTKQAKSIYEKHGWKNDVAIADNNFGSIYMDMQQFDKALPYLFNSYKLRLETKDRGGLAMTYQNLGVCYLQLDSAEAAKYYLDMAIALSDSVGDMITGIESRKNMANYYRDQNNPEQALKYINEALSIAKEQNGYVMGFSLYQTAKEIYAESKKFENAYLFSEKYHALKDSINNSENSRSLVQREEKFKYEQQKLQDALLIEKEKIKQEAEVNRRKVYNYFFATGLIALMIVIFFIVRNLRDRKRANELLQARNNLILKQNSEISQQNQIIEEKNKDITDSIQYAKRLQDSILPSQSQMNQVLGNHFVLFLPKDIVSGDFYWTFEINENDKLFAVIDCTGHGVPGGFMSIVAYNAINRAVKEFGLRSPEAILDKVNELIEENFSQNDKEEIRDGMDIALCRIQGKKLSFSGANNPLWIIRNNEHIEIKADKQPIGFFEYRKPFTLHEFNLESRDLVYVFSDGFADQFGGPAGKKFKYAQLRDKLLSLVNHEMNEQWKALLDAHRDWKGALEQIDDICVVGVKIS